MFKTTNNTTISSPQESYGYGSSVKCRGAPLNNMHPKKNTFDFDFDFDFVQVKLIHSKKKGLVHVDILTEFSMFPWLHTRQQDHIMIWISVIWYWYLTSIKEGCNIWLRRKIGTVALTSMGFQNRRPCEWWTSHVAPFFNDSIGL